MATNPEPGQHSSEVVQLSEERFRLLVEGVRDYAIFLLSPTGKVASWNTGAGLIKGYRADEIIGQHFSRFFTEEAVRQGKPAELLRRAAAEGRFTEENWRVRKDGTLFWASVLITPLRDEAGALIGYSKVTRDLTERRRTEEALRQSEERYRLLVKSVEDYAIFMLDPVGNVLTWNIGAERLKGYRAEEIIGQHFSRFYPPEDVAAGKTERELHVATAEGRCEDEGWRVRRDGTRFWANVVLTALHDAAGKLQGFTKITRDLTQRLRTEEQARRLASEQAARTEAEAASRRKDQFLAMLAHELRNPLAPLLTGVALLRKPGMGGTAGEPVLAMLDRQLRHMSRMVDDLLDASRIAGGSIQIRRERLDFARLVRTACEDRRLLADQNGRTLTVEAPTTPLWVNGDPTRLNQVVANLIDNSLKFTDRGGSVSVHLRGDKATRSAVLTVRDTGIGIEAEMLAHVFDTLAQADRSLARTRGGLGLGLALVRGLAGLHGGEVQVTSAGAGQGAEFTVRLPLEPEPEPFARNETAAENPAEIPATQRRLKILVIEDHRDSADSLKMLLELMGHEVAVAYTGSDGVREALRWQPEVVVSDIGLPGLNGLEVAAALRRNLSTAAARLVALSGYGSEEDRSRSRQAGFDFHLCKPADLAQLRSILHGSCNVGAN